MFVKYGLQIKPQTMDEDMGNDKWPRKNDNLNMNDKNASKFQCHFRR